MGQGQDSRSEAVASLPLLGEPILLQDRQHSQNSGFGQLAGASQIRYADGATRLFQDREDMEGPLEGAHGTAFSVGDVTHW